MRCGTELFLAKYVHTVWLLLSLLHHAQIHAVLGGQLKHVVCGSAPISADVMDFLKIAFSCEVVEGEFLICSASSTLNLLG